MIVRMRPARTLFIEMAETLGRRRADVRDDRRQDGRAESGALAGDLALSPSDFASGRG